MLELGPFAAAPFDLLRLFAVPAFVWAAWRDVATRRITNRLWPPLLVLAVFALAIEGYDAWLAGGFIWEQFLYVTLLSIGVLIPLAFAFWYFGGFGGADAKAIMILAVLFPTYPTYVVIDWTFPMVEPAVGVFSLAILTNAVILGLIYPLSLGVRNAIANEFAWAMFIGRQIDVSQTVALPGRLLESPEGFDRSGLDLDALRMYLSWRGITIEQLRSDPERYRVSLPDDPGDPGDGAVTDGGEFDDPWGANAFLKATDNGAYGTTPETLREGLEVLAYREVVWYSPGIPFVLLLAAGLLLAVIYGDLFLSIIEWVAPF